MAEWHDNLPDELKANATLAKYETPEAAYQGLIEANSRLGRSITIPSEDAGEDARTAYLTKLREAAPELTFHPDHADDHGAEFWNMAGVPEDAKDYKPAEGFEGLPDDYVENLRATAKAAGWTNKQFQNTLVEFAREFGEQNTAIEEAQTADADIVTAKWGNAEADKKGAIAFFKKSLDTKAFDFTEYESSKAMLQPRIPAPIMIASNF